MGVTVSMGISYHWYMSPDFIDICQQLETWYQRPAGKYLLEQERVLAKRLLEQVFGYHLLQIGVTRDQPLVEECGLNHRIYMGATTNGAVGLVSEGDSLPLANDSIDAVILHHALDFAPDPHQLLREVQRVLSPQGRVVILGFNPWSLAGMGSRLRALAPGRLWRASNRLSAHRVRDWLNLLGCEVETLRHTYATPPRGNGRVARLLQKVDGFATRQNLYFGGVYAMRAQKFVSTLTPTRQRVPSSMRGQLIGLAVPRSVARGGDGDASA